MLEQCWETRKSVAVATGVRLEGAAGAGHHSLPPLPGACVMKRRLAGGCGGGERKRGREATLFNIVQHCSDCSPADRAQSAFLLLLLLLLLRRRPVRCNRARPDFPRALAESSDGGAAEVGRAGGGQRRPSRSNRRRQRKGATTAARNIHTLSHSFRFCVESPLAPSAAVTR